MKLTQEFVDIAIFELKAERIGKSNRFRYVSVNGGQAYGVTKRQLWELGKAIKAKDSTAILTWTHAIEVPENAVK